MSIHKILRDNKSTLEEKYAQILQLLRQNFKLYLNETDENGFSPLFIIDLHINGGQPYKKIKQLLLKHQAKYNDKDKEADINLKKASKQGLIHSLFDVINTINPEMTERYSKAVRPEHLIFADRLPSHPNVQLNPVKLSVAELEIGKKWCTTYMIAKGLRSLFDCEIMSDDPELNKIITSPFFDLIFAKMGKFGRGVFATKEGIPAGTKFFYGGLLRKSSDKYNAHYTITAWSSLLETHLSEEDQKTRLFLHTTGKLEGNACLDGDKSFNFMTMMQHLISQDELSKIRFVIPEMTNTIAVENVKSDFANFNGNPECLFEIKTKVAPNHIIGRNYGRGYWRAKNMVPAIFDQKGRYVSPAFYTHREIYVRTSEAVKVNDITTAEYLVINNYMLAAISKEQGEQEFYNIQTSEGGGIVKRQWLIDQDIIPAKPHCLNDKTLLLNENNPKLKFISQEELSAAFLAAAAVDDLNTIRYFVEWLQPAFNVNSISTKNNSNQKTALHYAVERGHYYVIAYLLIHGANMSLKDTTGKTAGEYTKDPEILTLIAQFNPVTPAFQKPAITAEVSLANSMANFGLNAAPKVEPINTRPEIPIEYLPAEPKSLSKENETLKIQSR